MLIKMLIMARLLDKYGYVDVKLNENSEWCKIILEEKKDESSKHGIPQALNYIPVYNGKIKDGKPSGFGMLAYDCIGGTTTYIGNFKKGRFHGLGYYEYLGSSISSSHFGCFKRGEKHGVGIEGDIEGLDMNTIGFWKNGEKIDKSISGRRA